MVHAPWHLIQVDHVTVCSLCDLLYVERDPPMHWKVMRDNACTRLQFTFEFWFDHRVNRGQKVKRDYIRPREIDVEEVGSHYGWAYFLTHSSHPVPYLNEKAD